MRLLIDFEIKDFDGEKAKAALAACEVICNSCDEDQAKCLLDTSDCPVKNAIEALSGLIRTGSGIRRYKEIGDI